MRNPAMSQRLLFKIFFAILTFSPILCHAQTPVLGNEPGEEKSLSLTGPLEIRQGECIYSATLNKRQIITHNTPDIVIYEKTPTIDQKLTPYLWQPETYSGFEWRFKNPGRRNLRWLGLICESAENLPFLKIEKSAQKFETNEIIESNKRKCPANLVNGKFILPEELGEQKNYTIESITKSNWTGFAVFHRSKSRNIYDQMRFCLLHDNVVLIGTTENIQPTPMLDEKFRTMTINFIKSIEFK